MEKLPYSGRMTAYEHKQEEWKDRPIEVTSNKAVRMQRILDVQWSDCPVEVEEQIKSLWRYNDLGNDHYFHSTTIKDLINLEKEGGEVDQWVEKPDDISYEQAAAMEREGNKVWGWIPSPIKTDYIVQFLRESGVPDDEEVWIHWWW